MYMYKDGVLCVVRLVVDWGLLRSAGTTASLTSTPHPTPEKYHSMWMHSDRGRSTVWPPKLQCTLVLEDVSLYDHGFVFLSKR